jgi:hypothetical protein
MALADAIVQRLKITEVAYTLTARSMRRQS